MLLRYDEKRICGEFTIHSLILGCVQDSEPYSLFYTSLVYVVPIQESSTLLYLVLLAVCARGQELVKIQNIQTV